MDSFAIGLPAIAPDSRLRSLLAIGIVLLIAALGGRIARRFRQPPVVGEMLAGLALGPVALGQHVTAVFPQEVRPTLTLLAAIGIIVFMFTIGLSIHAEDLNSAGWHLPAVVAVSGTAVPFVIGATSALFLHPSHVEVDLPAFSLFIGAAMSITAFPVLARVLVERGLYHSPLGTLAMAAAAMDDVLTWATLAAVVMVLSASDALNLLAQLALTILFVAAMIYLVRPWCAAWQPLT
jgi:Kef-type K+ transport system membrane component KefB